MPLPQTEWEIAERIFEAYPGGEPAFWRDWGLGRLAPETMEWFRAHAADVIVEIEVEEADARLARLGEGQGEVNKSPPLSIEERRKRWVILEALALAVELPGPPTLLASKPSGRAELRRQFAEALFGLLERDLDLDPAAWTGAAEVSAGTAVVRAVFPEDVTADSPDAPGFVEIRSVLNELRDRDRKGVPTDPAEQALRELAGPLLMPAENFPGYRLEPSFRNYLRARLGEACRRQGWQPRPDGRFEDLDAALASLTREKVIKAFNNLQATVLEPMLAVDRLVTIS